MIYGFLKQILSARYGRDVRQAIHDAIQQCYYDGKAGSIDMEARESVEVLNGEVESLKEADIAINESIDILESDVAGLKESTETMSEDIETMQSMLQGTNDITTTTETTMPNSCEGRLLFKEIGGKTEKLMSNGKNLIDFRKSNASTTGGGVTYTLQPDGSFKRTGTATSVTGNAWLMGGYAITPNENNTIIHLDAGEVYVGRDCVFFSNQIGTGLVGGVYVDPAVYPNGMDITGIRNIEHKVGKTYNDTVYPMLCKASDGDEWEPYDGGTPKPFIRSTKIRSMKTHGKNMFNCNGLIKQTFRGINYTPIYDLNGNLLYVEIDGTASGGVSTYSLGTFKFDSSSPCILSGCPSGGSDSKYTIYTEKPNVGTDYGEGVTITHSGFAAIRIGVANGVTVNKLRFYPMIRKVDDADATYEPYCGSSFSFDEPIELNKIGDVQDVIVDGKPIRKFGVRVLNGSEIWTLATDIDIRSNTFHCEISDAKRSISTQNGICDAYTFVDTSQKTLEDKECTMFHDVTNVYQGTNWIYLRDTSCANVSALKAKLQANPITVVYELETPVTEALPIADQVALNSVKTFDGTTYLEFDSPLQPEFVAEYGTSKVGGVALANSLILNGDCFEFAEHGLTFKGLKVGNMVVVHASGALDYAITEENKNIMYNSVIPEGFRPIATTHASCVGITHKDGEGNKITDMFNLGIGGSGAIGVQVELKNNAGQSITVSKPGLPLNMSISYISE